MSRRHSLPAFTHFRPEQSAGNLYYVRLKTTVGPLYKLGYTTLPSVEQRLGFKGEGHEKLIDKVLFFAHFNDAAEMEAQLHRHFHRQAAFSKIEPEHLGPLYGNGQSELYVEDILGLDGNCSPEQIAQTKRDISCAYPTSSHRHLDDETLRRKEASDNWISAVANVLAFVVLLPAVICMSLWRLFRPKQGDSVTAMGVRYIESFGENKEWNARQNRERYGRPEPTSEVAEILSRLTAAATARR